VCGFETTIQTCNNASCIAVAEEITQGVIILDDVQSIAAFTAPCVDCSEFTSLSCFYPDDQMG
jgi:hypothetical protein